MDRRLDSAACCARRRPRQLPPFEPRTRRTGPLPCPQLGPLGSRAAASFGPIREPSRSREFGAGWAFLRQASETWSESARWRKYPRRLMRMAASMACPSCPRWRSIAEPRARCSAYVDKIYDYGGRKDLRRMKDAVLVAGLRCDGERARRLPGAMLSAVEDRLAHPQRCAGRGDRRRAPRAAFGPTFVKESRGDRKEIHLPVHRARPGFEQDEPAGSAPRPAPLIGGNVTLAAFAVAMLTRLFNLAQRLRGGIGFPANQRELQPPSRCARTQPSAREKGPRARSRADFRDPRPGGQEPRALVRPGHAEAHQAALQGARQSRADHRRCKRADAAR